MVFPLIYRYIAGVFFVSFLILLGTFIGLITLFELIELLRRSASVPDVSFADVFVLALFKMPRMLHALLPFTVMGASILTFWKLARSHELVAIRGAGISVWGFIAPVVGLTFLFGVLNITLVNPLSAMLFKIYNQRIEELKIRPTSLLFVSPNGLLLKETTDASLITVLAGGIVEQVKKDGKQTGRPQDFYFADVTVLEQDKELNFIRRLEAESAHLIPPDLVLRNGFVMVPEKLPEHFDELKFQSKLTTQSVQDNLLDPEALSFWELPSFIDGMDRAGYSARNYKLYFQSLLASPFLLCATVFLAASLSLSPNQRQGRTMMKITIAIATGFIFFFVSRLTYALGFSSMLPPTLAIWAAPVIFIFLGSAVLLHIEDG